MSRCRCIIAHIFGFVQATPLGLGATERRVILDAGYEFSILTQKLFFWQAYKGCVAITYFRLPVNRKQEKRCEFFRGYLHYGASYAPVVGGLEIRVILDAGYENSKTLFFSKYLKTATEQAPICGASCNLNMLYKKSIDQ